MKTNYQKILEKEIMRNDKDGIKPKLLLHSCCAPCSTYVIEYLADHFEITVYFFNPNIFPDFEYQKRLEEQIRLVQEMEISYNIEVVGTDHEPESFYNSVKGFESVKEGGERCWKCFELRLERAAEYALSNSFDYFSTTLTISPLKNAKKLNEIGLLLENKLGIRFLQSDFKKKEGFKKSVKLSEKHGLYRQEYCGCVYSKNEAEERNNEKTD